MIKIIDIHPLRTLPIQHLLPRCCLITLTKHITWMLTTRCSSWRVIKIIVVCPMHVKNYTNKPPSTTLLCVRNYAIASQQAVLALRRFVNRFNKPRCSWLNTRHCHHCPQCTTVIDHECLPIDKYTLTNNSYNKATHLIRLRKRC